MGMVRGVGRADTDAVIHEFRVDPARHREAVVSRLLDLGISAPTLQTILPDFRGLIERTAGRR